MVTSRPRTTRAAAIGLDQRGEDAHRRGLAGAVRSEQTEHAADGNVERHTLQRFDRAEGLDQVLDDDGRFACGARACGSLVGDAGGAVVHTVEPSTRRRPCPQSVSWSGRGRYRHRVPRAVTLVLLRADGSLVGEMAPFPVSTPWWQEVETVVDAAAARGADVSVLRLVHTEPDLREPSQMGGAVTYAAELHGDVPPHIRPVDAVATVDAVLDDEPLRLPWARPGGPAQDLAWAEHVLAERHRQPTGRPRQMRTWNLSSIWMIPTSAGPVWLKSVPPFFAHEGRIIEWLGRDDVPPLLGSEAGRVLMDDIPGDDQYDAPLPVLQLAVETLVAIQHRALDRVDELRGLGLPDWRWDALLPMIDDVVDRHRARARPLRAGRARRG